MGAPPKTFSIESLQSLKLIAYPPNAFRPFAMSSSSFVGRVTVPWPGGITTTGTRGEKGKIPSLGGPRTSGKYPGGYRGGLGAVPRRSASARLERRHHLAREPAELLLELLGREALGPVDHEGLESGVLRLDGLDPLDDVRRRAAEPGLLLDAVGERRHARGRARRAPRAAVLVRVAHETERREPLVALVVRRLHAVPGLLGRVGEEEPGAPDHVLAELLPATVLGARVAVRPHHVVEDLLAVEGHHGLEVLAGHVVDGLAARDRHPDLHGQVLRPRHTCDLAELVAAVLHRRRAVVALAVVAERLLVEALEQEVDLLLEQLPVRRLVDDGRPERLDLPRVVAASHAHDHPTVSHDVRHRVVLGEADGVPHREDVEGAAELEAPRLRGEPERELDEVREALVALALEVVLRRPQRVVPELVHQLGDVPRGKEHLAQPLVAVAPGVRRRAFRPDVLQLDLADVERVESFDHRAVHPPSMTSVCPVT